MWKFGGICLLRFFFLLFGPFLTPTTHVTFTSMTSTPVTSTIVTPTLVFPTHGGLLGEGGVDGGELPTPPAERPQHRLEQTKSSDTHQLQALPFFHLQHPLLRFYYGSCGRGCGGLVGVVGGCGMLWSDMEGVVSCGGCWRLWNVVE